MWDQIIHVSASMKILNIVSCSLNVIIYSELDSSGSVKKLMYGVSLKRKSGETELYILFNKLFLFTLIQFMKSFNL